MIHINYVDISKGKILLTDTQTVYTPRVGDDVRIENNDYRVIKVITDLTDAIKKPQPWFTQDHNFDVWVYLKVIE